MRDNCSVDCTQCKEALSAQLDGEESPAERGAIDAHLAICGACRWFADEAARVTRLARTTVVTQTPDVTVGLVFTIDGLATVLQALTDLDRADIAAAATAADRCAAECGQHAGHHGHCRVHSESAQRAADLCRSELANITA